MFHFLKLQDFHEYQIPYVNEITIYKQFTNKCSSRMQWYEFAEGEYIEGGSK